MIIAHYRRPKILLQLILLLIVLLSPVVATIWVLRRHPTAGFPGPLIFSALIISWAAATVVVFMVLAILRQIVFHSSRAIWVENDTILFVHRWIFSARCKEVISASRTKPDRPQPGIVLRLRSGGAKTFPTGSLAESTDVIISRIEDSIRSASR
jgi:hypothetical protein